MAAGKLTYQLTGVVRDKAGAAAFGVNYKIQPLAIPRGDTCDVDVTVYDENGTKVNLTGASLSLVVRAVVDNPDNAPLLTKAATLVDAPNGLARFSFATADLASLAMETNEYSVRLTSGANSTTIIPVSAFTVDRAAA